MKNIGESDYAITQKPCVVYPEVRSISVGIESEGFDDVEFAVSNRDAVYSESVKRTLSKESNESIEMRLVWVCARLNCALCAVRMMQVDVVARTKDAQNVVEVQQ